MKGVLRLVTHHCRRPGSVLNHSSGTFSARYSAWIDLSTGSISTPHENHRPLVSEQLTWKALVDHRRLIGEGRENG